MWVLIEHPARHAGLRLAAVAGLAGVAYRATSRRSWPRSCCWRRGAARAPAGWGWSRCALVVIFWINPASYTPQYKSDMRDIGAEMAPQLHAGDLVIVGQPEQVPLAWYYLPGGSALRRHDGPRRATRGT